MAIMLCMPPESDATQCKLGQLQHALPCYSKQKAASLMQLALLAGMNVMPR